MLRLVTVGDHSFFENIGVNVDQAIADAGLESVATDYCPYGLPDAVDDTAAGLGMRSSLLWSELILSGASKMLSLWESCPETNAAKAWSSMNTLMLNGQNQAVSYRASILSELCWKPDIGESIVLLLSPLKFTDGDYLSERLFGWGIGFDEACCLFAYSALTDRGISILRKSSIVESATDYIKMRVWLARALWEYK